MMKHGSLFSGGGGFDLAANTVGWTNVFHVERDAFCQRILKYYWPQADCFEDIKNFNGKLYRGKIDVLTGGFPCQPFSNAGHRRGTEDDRYLWPEMLRVIQEIKPRWIVGENVYGFVNWNEGLVFDQVLSDLEAEGYAVQAYLLPASGVNAPHQRYRVWLVAFDKSRISTRQQEAYTHSCGYGRLCTRFSRTIKAGRRRKQCKQFDSLFKVELEALNAYAHCYGCDRMHGLDDKFAGQGGQYAQHDLEPLGVNATDTDSERLYLSAKVGEMAGQRSRFPVATGNWREWPTQPPLCGRDDGVPSELDGITVSKWREKSVQLFGNAIVPQVAVQLFRAINQYELLYPHSAN